jgi:hypothetical protein
MIGMFFHSRESEKIFLRKLQKKKFHIVVRISCCYCYCFLHLKCRRGENKSLVWRNFEIIEGKWANNLVDEVDEFLWSALLKIFFFLEALLIFESFYWVWALNECALVEFWGFVRKLRHPLLLGVWLFVKLHTKAEKFYTKSATGWLRGQKIQFFNVT